MLWKLDYMIYVGWGRDFREYEHVTVAPMFYIGFPQTMMKILLTRERERDYTLDQ
jgi:hypothetical protein